MVDDGELDPLLLEPEPVELEPELLLLGLALEPVPLVEEPEPYPLLLGLALEFVLLEPEDDGEDEDDGVAESLPLVLVPVELPAELRLRREREVVEFELLSTLVPDWPVCDAVGAVGSLGLPEAAGDELDGIVDCDEEDDCAYAPVARIVHSASEPIPSTFVVELM